MSSSITVASGLSLSGWLLGKYKITLSLSENIQDATQQLYLQIGTGLSSGTGPAVLLDYDYSITYEYNGQSTTKSNKLSKHSLLSSGTISPGLTIDITDSNRAVTQYVTITAFTLTLKSDLYGPSTYTMSSACELDRTPIASIKLVYSKPAYHDTPEKILQEISVIPTHPVTITGTVFPVHGYNCSAPWKTSDGTTYNAGNSIYVNGYTKLSGTISNRNYNIVYHEPNSSQTTVKVNSYDTYITMPSISGTTDPTYKYLGWSTKVNPTLSDLEYVVGASVARVGLLAAKYPDSSNDYTVHLYPVSILKDTTIKYDQGFTSKYIDQSRTDSVQIDNIPVASYNPLRESAYSFNSLKSVGDRRLVAPSGSGSTILVLTDGQTVRSYYRKNTSGTVYCGIVTFNGGTQESPSYYTGLLLVSTSISSKYYFDGTSYSESIDQTYSYQTRVTYNGTTYYATTDAALAGTHNSVTEQSEFNRIYVGDYSDQVYSEEVLVQMSTDLLNLYNKGIPFDDSSTYKTLGSSTVEATWDIKDGYDYVKVNGTWRPAVIFRKVNNHWTRCLVNNKDSNKWGIRPYKFVIDTHNSDEASRYYTLENSEDYTTKYSSTLDKDIASITINKNHYGTSEFKRLPRMTGDTSIIYNVVSVDQPTIKFENTQEIYIDSSRGINVPIRSKVSSQAQDSTSSESELTMVSNSIRDQENKSQYNCVLYTDHIGSNQLTDSIYLRLNNLSKLLYNKTVNKNIFKGFVYVLSGCTSSLYKSTISLQITSNLVTLVTEANVTIIYKDTSGDIRSKELNTIKVETSGTSINFSAEIDDPDNSNFKEDMSNLIRNYPISSLNSNDDRYFAILVEVAIDKK